MHKKVSVGIAASLVLIAITITFSATMILAMNVFSDKVNVQREATYKKILEIDKAVSQYFYRHIDGNDLYNSLIGGYMSGLDDPDSMYLTAAEIAQRDQRARGTVVSVGLEVVKNENGYFTVTRVYADSSAFLAKMQAGDVITKIGRVNEEKQDLFPLSVEEVNQMVNGGVEGDKITLDYTRYNEGEVTSTSIDDGLDFKSIAVRTVEGKKIDNVYYIGVKALWNTASAQFDKALSEAKSNYAAGNVSGMVIDLRNVHEGNSLDVVKDMLNRLMPTGTTVLGVYRGGEEKVLCTSDSSEKIEIPFVVLINQNTKGYAEILAAVLKENKLCRDVVGFKTAGSGTYRSLIRLSDGSGIELSVAELKPPIGPVFHGVGITPVSEVRAPDNFILTDTPATDTDPQFAKAVDVLEFI